MLRWAIRLDAIEAGDGSDDGERLVARLTAAAETAGYRGRSALRRRLAGEGSAGEAAAGSRPPTPAPVAPRPRRPPTLTPA